MPYGNNVAGAGGSTGIYGTSPGTQFYGGNKMAFGIDDALAAGSGLASGIGGAISSGKNALEQRYATNTQMDLGTDQMLQRYLEWRRSQGLAEAGVAGNAQRDIEKLPMRDRLQYMLSARMGLPTQNFTYNRGALPSSSANYNTAEMFNQAQSRYAPGAGGVDMSGKIQHQLLDSLGYGGDGTTSLLDERFRAPGAGEKYTDYLSRMLASRVSGQDINAPVKKAAIPRTAMPPAPTYPMGGGSAPGGYRIPTQPFNIPRGY